MPPTKPSTPPDRSAAGGPAEDPKAPIGGPVPASPSNSGTEDSVRLHGLPPLEQVVAIARAAGAEILRVYATAFEIRAKREHGPVTLADENAERLITQALNALTPDIPVIAEEAFDQSPVHTAPPRFWLVDPLDGTCEFIDRNGEFTVNIALIEGTRPVLGVVFAPALGELYAVTEGQRPFLETPDGRREIACRPPPEHGITLLTSRSHADDAQLAPILARPGMPVVAERIGMGSSLKFCRIAAGGADLYPRTGRTMEWDTAAAHAILRAAGGHVETLGGAPGAPLEYAKPGFENPGFIARGRDTGTC